MSKVSKLKKLGIMLIVSGHADVHADRLRRQQDRSCG